MYLLTVDPKSKMPESVSASQGESSLGEKLDRYYLHRKVTDETTSIPISLLTALDGIVKGTYAENPDTRAQQQNQHKQELTAHLRRVAAYAQLLAEKLGLDKDEAKLVKQVCPMHDIGKWMIPAHILQKPSALDEAEWTIMKTHALAGYEILKDSKLEVLKLGAMVAMQHQEKFDGTGYPLGMKGEEIHLYSRITTVVDVFDALGSARAYKNAWPIDDIVTYFQHNRGTHFDPKLVDTLLENMDDFVRIRSTFV